MKPEQDDQASRTPDWKVVSAYLDEAAKYHTMWMGNDMSDKQYVYNNVCAQIFAVLSGAIKEGLR